MILFYIFGFVLSNPVFFVWEFYNEGTDCALQNRTMLFFIKTVENHEGWYGCAIRRTDWPDIGGNIAIYAIDAFNYTERSCATCAGVGGCPDEEDWYLLKFKYGSCNDNNEGNQQSRKVSALYENETFTIPDGWMLKITYKIHYQDEVNNIEDVCRTHDKTKAYESVMYKSDEDCESESNLKECVIQSDYVATYKICGGKDVTYPFTYTTPSNDDRDDIQTSVAAHRFFDGYFYSVNLMLLCFVIFCIYYAL